MLVLKLYISCSDVVKREDPESANSAKPEMSDRGDPAFEFGFLD